MKKMQRIVCVVLLLVTLLGLVAVGITSCIDGKAEHNHEDDEFIILDEEFIEESGDLEDSFIEEEHDHDHEE